MNLRKSCFCVFGYPGIGKTTFIKLLVQSNSDVSACFPGEELRKMSTENELVAEKIKLGICQDELDPLVGKIVHSSLNDFLSSDKNFFFFDGYPRKTNQFENFKNLLLFQNIKVYSMVLTADPEITFERIKNRNRLDYTIDIHEKRINEFKQDTEPLFKKFFDENFFIENFTIDANLTIQDILDKSNKMLEVLRKNVL